MEYAVARRAFHIQQLAAQKYQPKGDQLIAHLVEVELELESFNTLAQRLNRSNEGEFADLALAIDTRMKLQPISGDYSFEVGGRLHLTPAEIARMERVLALRAEHHNAAMAVREAAKKIGNK